MVKYHDLLQQWLDTRGWSDEIEIDEPGQLLQVGAGIEVNEQGYRLYVETDGHSDFFDVYVYPPYGVKEANLAEAWRLVNHINGDIGQGRFVVTPSRRFQYNHRVDMEDAAPSVTTIENMVRAAWDFCETWDAALAAVSLTATTAQEIIQSQTVEIGRRRRLSCLN